MIFTFKSKLGGSCLYKFTNALCMCYFAAHSVISVSEASKKNQLNDEATKGDLCTTI